MKSLNKANFGFHTLETLSEGNTLFHQLNVLPKTITTFLYVVIVISFNRYEISGLMPFTFYPIIVMAIAEIPYKPLLSRLAVALPFSLFAGMANIIFDTNTAFYLFSLPISYGVISFISILIKTILTVMAVLILIATTPMPLISKQLITLKVPPILVMTISMVYRYISVLIEETLSMVTSYKLRNPNQKGIKMKDMGIFVGQLILRSIDRAERVYLAMKCRGYTGDYQYLPLLKLNKWEICYLVSFILALTVCRFINISIIIGNIF